MNESTEALYDAIRTGNAEGARAALAAGADVHRGDGDVLCYAALFGAVEIVGILLASGAIVHARHGDAMCYAAGRGNVAVINMLLDAGSDVHANDDAALHWAARDRHHAAVRILLDAGSNPVIVLKNAPQDDRNSVVATLDACADAFTTEQRGALLAISRPGEFVQLRALDASARKRDDIRR